MHIGVYVCTCVHVYTCIYAINQFGRCCHIWSENWAHMASTPSFHEWPRNKNQRHIYIRSGLQILLQLLNLPDTVVCVCVCVRECVYVRVCVCVCLLRCIYIYGRVCDSAIVEYQLMSINGSSIAGFIHISISTCTDQLRIHCGRRRSDDSSSHQLLVECKIPSHSCAYLYRLTVMRAKFYSKSSALRMGWLWSVGSLKI